MRLQRLILAALAAQALCCHPASAQGTPDPAEVTEARISLDAAAEEAIGKFWPILSGELRTDGIDLASARRASRWAISSFSLGWCARFATFELIEDVDQALDRALPVASSWAVGRVREEGTRLRREGAEMAVPGETPTQQAAFCAVELEAVRQVIAAL